MDASDTDVDDSVMLAFLPVQDDWCNIDLPHMTLVYGGSKKKLGPGSFNTLAKDAASIAMLITPFTLRVTGVEVFGDEERVNVLRLQATSGLLAVRRFVESWNASEYPFKPHATIGPVNTQIKYVPQAIDFNRIMVAWGEEDLTFWLKQ